MTSFRKALVLSGGSVKGAFQAGALSVALKHYQPDSIYGISAGSLNGAFIANRANEMASHGREINWENIGSELCEFWEDEIQYPDDVIKHKSALKIAANIAMKRWNGLYTNAPLKAKLNRVINETWFETVGSIYLSVGVVDLQTGKKMYMDYTGTGKYFKDYILASAAIPYIMPTSKINRNYALHALLDGGLRDSSPLSEALRKGAEEVLCIYCHPEELEEKANLNPGNFKEYSERIMDIISNENINNDHKLGVLYNKLLAAGPEINDPESPLYGKRIVMGIEKPIRPERALNIDIEKFDKQDIKRLIDLGRNTTAKYFLE